MRGAPWVAWSTLTVIWIIPADAGSTIERIIMTYEIKDHPRRCGEHFLPAHACSLSWGSSPQMRGARPVLPAAVVQPRIIPADAGSTFLGSRYGSRHEDHPRRCGEHCFPVPSALGLGGSSPQMRGALGLPDARAPVAGIIPADAGSTLTCALRRWRWRDHSRRCGEHSIGNPNFTIVEGSSPQMRGALWIRYP